MSKQTDVYSPIGGINSELPEWLIGKTEVRDSENLLFERGTAKSRPGVSSTTLTGITAGVDIKMGVSVQYGLTAVNAVLAGNAIYSLTLGLAATALSGPALTLGSAWDVSLAWVNGLMMAGGNTGGLIRWDPTGSTYTVISAAPYKFVTGHRSQAVAAYKITGNSLIGPRTVAWSSAQGGEADWTGYGSGSTVLADCATAITAICTLRDAVVVARSDGFHLGRITGSADPAYRFEPHSSNGPGAYWGETLATDGDNCYFVARDGVYSFDTTTVTPIGTKINRELIARLTAGARYRGFVSQVNGASTRRHYHLVPLTGALPHYCYDLQEGIWSKHTYAFPMQGGWYQIGVNATSGPLLVEGGDQAKAWRWSDSTLCEQDQWLRGRSFILGDPMKEAKVSRAMLYYRSTYDLNGLQLFMGGMQGKVQASRTTGADLTGEGEWRRKWFNFQLSGNLFKPDIYIPANNSIEIGGLAYQYEAQCDTPAL